MILDDIRAADSILLHCHPSPDPDSVGSALAMKFALEQLGKKATLIRGDSEIPKAFMHFPGAGDIVNKNFFEIDISGFDLFIVLDSGQSGISRLGGVVFPPTLKIINIDHHRTNPGCGSVNLIDPSYPATCLILFDLFKEWNIKLDENIASNLFIGTYTDTGGFKYEGVSSKTFAAAAELVTHIEDLPRLISRMENSNTPGLMIFNGAALSSISVFFDGILAISSVSYSTIEAKKIPVNDVSAGQVSSFMRSVSDWSIVACAVESAPNSVKLSLRSKDSNKYDVSRLAAELGGGGHKAAAGAILSMPLDQAFEKVVSAAKVMYNL
ncbi:MAG: bifunctional oligoribonuclease/PAP phosphatase NrnA [bacterium]|nr:bifunctional oligoribonuclease/PAP phosphatase NrnA [bacterium]